MKNVWSVASLIVEKIGIFDKLIPQTNGSVIFYVGNDFQWNGTIVANARLCQTANKFLVRGPCHYDEMRQRFLSLRDVQNARRGNPLASRSPHCVRDDNSHGVRDDNLLIDGRVVLKDSSP